LRFDPCRSCGWFFFFYSVAFSGHGHVHVPLFTAASISSRWHRVDHAHGTPRAYARGSARARARVPAPTVAESAVLPRALAQHPCGRDEETHATRKGCAEIRPVPRSVVSSPPCHSAKAGKPSVDVGPGGASSSGQRARCLTSYKVMVLCSPSVRPPLLASIQHRVKHAHNEGAAYAWHGTCIEKKNKKKVSEKDSSENACLNLNELTCRMHAADCKSESVELPVQLAGSNFQTSDCASASLLALRVFIYTRTCMHAYILALHIQQHSNRNTAAHQRFPTS
jgi:hypothetical protein